jgi:nucleoside-diphosphate-sugar epimerase
MSRASSNSDTPMILVTGATGLSGSYVVRELHQRGLAVRALVLEASVPAAQALNADVASGDLAGPDSLRRACDGVTGVVHTACTFTDSTIDIAAMEALLEGWRGIEGSVRSSETGPILPDCTPVGYFSSLDVYGLSTAPLISEDTPFDETYNDYARGKVVSERLLTETAHAQSQSDFSILRAPHIWAPHPKARKRLAGLVESDTVLLPGADEAEWSTYRDAWIDARDLAWIVAECLAHPIGVPANVLAGHFVWHDLFAELIRVTGSPCRLVNKAWAEMTDEERAARRFYAQTWRYDDRRLCDQLGFRPSRTWQQTVAETLS